MNNFKLIKRGTVYTPIQVTSETGAVIVLYADSELLKTGGATDLLSFEELNSLEGGLRVILNQDK